MRNPYGLTSKAPKEWGRKARQEEDQLRGFRRRGREDAVTEGLDEMIPGVDYPEDRMYH